MAIPGRSSHAAARAFVDWTLRWGRWIWLVAVIAAVPATFRTVALYRNLKSDIEELLPRDSPSVKAIEELRARTTGLRYLGVVVDAGSREKLPAAERFVDALAERVRAYPADLVASVRTGTAEERAFLESHAPLYLDVADLERIRARVEARRDWEVARETGAALDEGESPPPLDFKDIEEKYRRRLPKPASGTGSGDRYSSEEQHTTMLLIEAGAFHTGAEHARALVSRVKEDIGAIGGTQAFAPGMRYGFGGDVAISVEEMDALVADLSVAGVLVIVAVVAVIIVYFRWPRSVLVLVPPLLLATVYAFSIASIPPFSIGELNSNTAFLGSIIVGNGINFAIVLLARYVEERRRGGDVRDSLVTAVWSSRAGTLAAALGAGVSYASLVVTHFRGFRQFGVIGGLGMVFSWLVAYVCMPPLIGWLDRRASRSGDTPDTPGRSGDTPDTPGRSGDTPDTPGRSGAPRTLAFRKLGPDTPGVRSHREIHRFMARLADFVSRFRVPVALLGAVLTLGSIVVVRGFSMDQLEYDFSKLRRADTWTTGEGYWGAKMDQLLGEYLAPTVILADAPGQACAIAAKLRVEEERPPLSGMVASVRALDDVLPSEQPKKTSVAREIREDMTPRMRSLLQAESKDAILRLVGERDPTPITLADLPRGFTTALVEKDGTAGRQVLVYPRAGKALWQGRPLIAFVATLRAVAAEAGQPPDSAGAPSQRPDSAGAPSQRPDSAGAPSQRPARVAGSLPLSADILRSIEHDGPLASALAFFGVIAVVIVMFLGQSTSIYVVASLTVGVLWLVAATMVFGVKINFANFIAFPITFGIGVDYAVNVMSRYVQDGRRDVIGTIRGTGSAVALCSLTTMIGYSSLLVAENRALFLFGLIAVLGEIACLTAAVTLLPSVLLLLQGRGRGITVAHP
jgi:predicted RND superfamily exporter protein